MQFDIKRAAIGYAVTFLVVGLAMTAAISFVEGTFWHPFGSDFDHKVARISWVWLSAVGIMRGWIT